MAKERSPNRNKAFELWRDSGGEIPLKNIAEQLGVSDSQIRKWKNQDKWEDRLNGNVTNETNGNVTNAANSNVTVPKKKGPPFGSQNAKGHGAPRGNKNAVGNKGGPPLGSKNALRTGEFETIWFDTLTEEEQALYGKVNTDTLAQVEEDLRLITLRERRMMERIRKLMDGLTEKQRKVLQERVKVKVSIPVTHEVTGETKIVMVEQPKMVITEITETECRAIDDILRIEEALTRVQQQKAKFIALKQDIEAAIEKSRESDKTNVIAAHNANVQTLASLLSSPVANRPIEAFEDEPDG